MKVKDFMNACLFDWDLISIVTYATSDPRDDEYVPVGKYKYVKDIPDNVWNTTIDYWDILCVNENGEDVTIISIIL